MKKLLLEDAQERLQVDESSLTYTSFEQLFSSTACGFPGIACAAMTLGTVHVFTTEKAAVVYINSRLAYVVNEFNSAFEDALSDSHLIEPHAYNNEYERDPLLHPRPCFSFHNGNKTYQHLGRAVDAAWTRVLHGGEPTIPVVISAIYQGGHPVPVALVSKGDSDIIPVIEYAADTEEIRNPFPTIKEKAR